MARKQESIPVNSMDDEFVQGIDIDKIYIEQSDFKASEYYAEASLAHRDEGHTFHIVEKGSVVIEIDFQKYKIDAPAIVYMHPNQVHRILEFSNICVWTLAVKNENLNTVYCDLLEELAPLKPLSLSNDISAKIFEIFTICLNFSRENNDHLHYLILKDSCNTLVGLIISVFLSQKKSPVKLSRMELISKAFQQLLEKEYCTIKRPGRYAELLNISPHYLNESVKIRPVYQFHSISRIVLYWKQNVCFTTPINRLKKSLLSWVMMTTLISPDFLPKLQECLH